MSDDCYIEVHKLFGSKRLQHRMVPDPDQPGWMRFEYRVHDYGIDREGNATYTCSDWTPSGCSIGVEPPAGPSSFYA